MSVAVAILIAAVPVSGLIGWALWLIFCAWIYRTSGHQASALRDAAVVARAWRQSRRALPQRDTPPE